MALQLAAIFFVTVANSVLCLQIVTNHKHVLLADKPETLEDLVRTVVEDLISEKYQWLVEKQSLKQDMTSLENIVRKQARMNEKLLSRMQQQILNLQRDVQRLDTLCSPLKLIFPIDNITNENEIVAQQSEVSPTKYHQPNGQKFFVRSDDTNPLFPVVTQLTERVNQVSAGLQALQNEVNEALPIAFASVFVHWGSASCTTSSVEIYSGAVGGSLFSSSGSATNYLCLPLLNINLLNSHPRSYYARLYGGEYETHDEHQDKDALCAVCRSSRATNVMIPARTICPAGWTLEYSGFLMAGYFGDDGASEFICVDSKLEERQGSENDRGGRILLYTYTVCGSLPCPPYVDSRGVPCVVCSK